MKSEYYPQPVPDSSMFSEKFTGWDIWTDIAETDKSLSSIAREPGLGLFLTEARIDSRRILGWAAVYTILGLILGFMASMDQTNLVLFSAIALGFFGLAFYRVAEWYLNRDISVRIYRAGFALAKCGKTQVVMWCDIDYVREDWEKLTIQWFIRIHKHSIEVYKANRQKVEMDNKLGEIEKIGSLIQTAVAEVLLPGMIECLKNDETCEFGPFKISRYGIAHKEKELIPWQDAKSLAVLAMGKTTLKFYKADKKFTWASADGSAVPNLQLFLFLTNWFIDAAKRTAPDTIDFPETSVETGADPFYGTEYCKLTVSRKEARLGTQRILYVGASKREKRLVVNVPADVKSHTFYRFPGYGRPDPQNGQTGVLNVEIVVEKGTLFKEKLEEIQMASGVIILILGMIWLTTWSSIDLITRTFLAALIGSVSGILIATRRRRLGALSGFIGGALSFHIHILYYKFMFIWFGRESFWNYEMAIVMLVSFLPGIGIFFFLTPKKK